MGNRCDDRKISMKLAAGDRQDMLIISEILALKAGKTAQMNKMNC